MLNLKLKQDNKNEKELSCSNICYVASDFLSWVSNLKISSTRNRPSKLSIIAVPLNSLLINRRKFMKPVVILTLFLVLVFTFFITGCQEEELSSVEV